jgi:hypothetical protein
MKVRAKTSAIWEMNRFTEIESFKLRIECLGKSTYLNSARTKVPNAGGVTRKLSGP